MSEQGETVVALNAVVLPQDCGIRRMAPRPACLQHESYPDKFDATTVIYDLFRTDDPTRLIAVCPPFFNLLDDLALRFTALPDETPCPFSVDVRAMTERLVITVPDGCTALRVGTAVGDWVVTPGPSLAARFAGARAIMTLSKDNDLQWIRDWALYHARAQGATAAVIYDNGSARYDAAELSAALEGCGLDHAVIPWPYRYGPNDHRLPATRRVFDSNFCQTSMLDHAWQRLFRRAQAVVNADIDEMIYTEGATVFERAESAPGGFLRYTGRWIEPLPIRPGRAPRHGDFWRTLRTAVPLHTEPKWAVAPAKAPEHAQWMVHDIPGMIPDPDSEDVSFGHFRGINSSVTVDAVGRRILKRTWAVPLTPTRVVEPLRAAMAAAFEGSRADVETRPRDTAGANPIAAYKREARLIAEAAETDPDAAPYWVAQAMSALRAFDDLEEMRRHAERAFALAPQDANAQEVLAASAPQGARIATLERIEAVPLGDGPDAKAERLTLLAHLAFEADPARSKALIDQALAAEPDRPGAMLVQARLLAEAGDTGAAADRFGALHDRIGGRIVPLARQRAFYDPVRRSFRVFFDPCGLHMIPGGMVLRQQAVLLMQAERLAEAVAPARALAAQEPFAFGSQMLLARALRRAGEADAARDAARNAAHAARVNLRRGTDAILFRPRHKSWCAARLFDIAQAQIFQGAFDDVLATAAEIRALGRPGRATLAQLRTTLEKYPRGSKVVSRL